MRRADQGVELHRFSNGAPLQAAFYVNLDACPRPCANNVLVLSNAAVRRDCTTSRLAFDCRSVQVIPMKCDLSEFESLDLRVSTQATVDAQQ
jgi:hypothetical protein